MKRVGTFAAGGQVPSATLNSIQDRGSSILPAANNNDLSAFVGGDDGLFWQATANLATGTLIQLDSGDWHDRYITGECFIPQVTGARIGQSLDYGVDAIGGGGLFYRVAGYLGKGARSNVTTGAAVANGAPPVRGTGAGGTSWVVNGGASELAFCIYTDPTTGALYAYNNTGSNAFPIIVIRALGVTGKRP